MRSRAGRTATTLILVGLLLQFLQVLVVFALGAIFLAIPLIGALLLAAGFFGLLWVALVYLFAYGRAREGAYEEARTPTLVFGILSLLTANLISGILYLIAFVKLGDAPSREPRDDPFW